MLDSRITLSEVDRGIGLALVVSPLFVFPRAVEDGRDKVETVQHC